MVRENEPMHFCRLFLFGRRVNVLLGFLNRGDGIVDGIDGVGHTGAVVRRLGAFRLVVVGDLSFVPDIVQGGDDFVQKIFRVFELFHLFLFMVDSILCFWEYCWHYQTGLLYLPMPYCVNYNFLSISFNTFMRISLSLYKELHRR